MMASYGTIIGPFTYPFRFQGKHTARAKGHTQTNRPVADCQLSVDIFLFSVFCFQHSVFNFLILLYSALSIVSFSIFF